jgi:expansin (peptidoglycan-binding protein)
VVLVYNPGMALLSQQTSDASIPRMALLTASLCAALLAACSGDDHGGGGDGGGDANSVGAGLSGSGSGNGSGSGSGAGAGPGGGCDIDGQTHTGDGTYYDADGSGNCSFPATPDDLMVAAMNDTDYAASAACGACIEITGPEGTITVRIVDRCPECPQGDVDMSPQAFEQIAPLEDGRVDISWRYVACGLSGPIVYHFKEGSNPYWTAVQIRNHRYPIAKLEFLAPDGSAVDVPRLDYNYFVKDDGMGEGPYQFRVTDVLGQALEDSDIPFVEAGDSPGAAQFPACDGP